MPLADAAHTPSTAKKGPSEWLVCGEQLIITRACWRIRLRRGPAAQFSDLYPCEAPKTPRPTFCLLPLGPALRSALSFSCVALLVPPALRPPSPFNAATLKGPIFLNSPENWLDFFNNSFTAFQLWRRESCRFLG